MKYINSKCVRVLLLLIFCVTMNTGCNFISNIFKTSPPPKTLEAPLKVNVNRGATRVDIYGDWFTDFSLVGQPFARFSYRVRYIPTGTEVYTDGTTNGSQLQAWDGLPVYWRFNGDVFEWGSTDRTLNVSGMAGITLMPSGQNGGTLTIHVRLPPITLGGLRPEVTGNTIFETDQTQPSVRR